MKLNSMGMVSLLTVMLTAGAANANLLIDGYVGATGGIGAQTLINDDEHMTRSAQSYGAVLGFDIPVLRVEGEYNYITTDDATLQTAMLNAYLKMPTTLVQPYIGAGIGQMFDGDIKNIELDKSIAYQGMLGLTISLPILPLKFDVEGRVLYIPDIIDTATASPDMVHYDGRIKVRYIF